VDWIHLANDTHRWLDVVNTLMKARFYNGQEFYQVSDYQLLKEDAYPWS
jgi:hypothetical protein